MSSLIFSKVIKTNLKKYKIQQFKFKNSTDCTAHYNQLVKKYAEDVSNVYSSYNLNDWTSNYFIKNNKPINISRFGDVIQITESKQLMNLNQFKGDFSEIYSELKKIKNKSSNRPHKTLAKIIGELLNIKKVTTVSGIFYIV